MANQEGGSSPTRNIDEASEPGCSSSQTQKQKGEATNSDIEHDEEMIKEEYLDEESRYDTDLLGEDEDASSVLESVMSTTGHSILEDVDDEGTSGEVTDNTEFWRNHITTLLQANIQLTLAALTGADRMRKEMIDNSEEPEIEEKEPVRKRRKTSKTKVYKCNNCEYTTSDKIEYDKHKKTHHVKHMFQCSFCDLQCSQKITLIRHIRTHTGERPFKCDLCAFDCTQKSTLVRHIRTHTGERPFECPSCGFKCARKSYLNNHLKIHTGERPFSCEYCDYTCAQKIYLYNHMKTHTQERPFECTVCDYKTGQKHHLKRHMKTHSDEFKCTYCDYRSTRRKTLANHIKHHLDLTNENFSKEGGDSQLPQMAPKKRKYTKRGTKALKEKLNQANDADLEINHLNTDPSGSKKVDVNVKSEQFGNEDICSKEKQSNAEGIESRLPGIDFAENKSVEETEQQISTESHSNYSDKHLQQQFYLESTIDVKPHDPNFDHNNRVDNRPMNEHQFTDRLHDPSYYDEHLNSKLPDGSFYQQELSNNINQDRYYQQQLSSSSVYDQQLIKLDPDTQYSQQYCKEGFNNGHNTVNDLS